MVVQIRPNVMRQATEVLRWLLMWEYLQAMEQSPHKSMVNRAISK